MLRSINMRPILSVSGRYSHGLNFAFHSDRTTNHSSAKFSLKSLSNTEFLSQNFEILSQIRDSPLTGNLHLRLLRLIDDRIANASIWTIHPLAIPPPADVNRPLISIWLCDFIRITTGPLRFYTDLNRRLCRFFRSISTGTPILLNLHIFTHLKIEGVEKETTRRIKEKETTRVREKTHRPVHTPGSLSPHLSDPSHSPVSENKVYSDWRRFRLNLQFYSFMPRRLIGIVYFLNWRNVVSSSYKHIELLDCISRKTRR
ncbi:hypothetical protein LXL04_028657 [Taraxacum kok-saghyz]